MVSVIHRSSGFGSTLGNDQMFGDRLGNAVRTFEFDLIGTAVVEDLEDRAQRSGKDGAVGTLEILAKADP